MRRSITAVALALSVLLSGLASAQDKKPNADAANPDVKKSEGKAGDKKKPDDADSFLKLVYGSQKLPKRIEEAPAIITVHQRSFIEAFGFQTLTDLLRTTPGYDARVSSWYNTPGTRGLAATALLMVDGTPINSHLSNLYPAGLGLDLSNYKRLEVISGPGGVLWGAHSLLGVVNLLTLDGADINGLLTRVEFGSFGRQRYSLKAGGVWKGVDGFLGLTFTTLRGHNAELDITTASSPTFGGGFRGAGSGETSNKNSMWFELVGKLRWKDFTLYARIPYSLDYVAISEEGGLLRFADNGLQQSDDWLTYLAYNRSIGPVNVLAKAYLYRNVLRFDNRLWSPNNVYPQGFGMSLDNGTALKIGGIVEGSWRLRLFNGLLTNKLLVGGEALRESVDGATVSISDANGVYGPTTPLIEDASAAAISVYASDEIRFADRVAISGGLRYNAADSYKNTLLLSASAVLRVIGKNYIKFNVAQGLRPPTMAMRFGRAPFSAPRGNYLNPNANTIPMEAATSVAYQWEVNSQILAGVGPIKAFFIRANLALTSVDAIKQLEPSALDDGVLYYLPRIYRDVLSVEGRADARFRGGHRAWASYSFNKVSVSGGDSAAELAQVGPRHALSLGASARLLRYFRLMAQATVETGVRSAVLKFDSTVASGGLPTVDVAPTTTLLNAGIFVDRIFRDLKLSLVAYNLLDQKRSFYQFTNVLVTGSQREIGQGGQTVLFPQAGLSVLFSAQMSLL